MSETTRTSRMDDMTNGKLVLTKTHDGDIGISISIGGGRVQFCKPDNGGGSPKTITALHALFDAIEKDNKERPDKRNPDP